MRKILHEFYRPSEDEFQALWSDGLFVLDANVLLDIYRYSPATTDQLLDVLSKLGDRVWVPYQAALEYQRNRNGVSAGLLEVYEKTAGKIDVAYKELEEALRKNAESAALLKSVTKSFETAKRSLTAAKAKHGKLIPADKLHERLTELLDGKVGNPYPKTELTRRYEVAEERLKERIPPGYRDAAKPIPDRYGDAIVWFELLDQATSSKQPIVFITGDTKEDWWWQEKGKTIGPRPELRREVQAVAGVDFYMYTTERFLEAAREYLGSEVSDEAIAEAREVQSLPVQYTYTALADALRNIQISSTPSPSISEALRNLQLTSTPTSVLADAIRNAQISTPATSALADAIRNVQISTPATSAIADAIRNAQIFSPATSISEAIRNLQLTSTPTSALVDAMRNAQISTPATSISKAIRNLQLAPTPTSALADAIRKNQGARDKLGNPDSKQADLQHTDSVDDESQDPADDE